MVIPKGRGTQPRSFFLRECVYVSMANNSNYSILSGSAGKGETSLSIDIPYPVENNNFIVWLILPTGQVVQGSGSYNNGRISITNNIDTSDEWGAIVYRAETAELNATLKSSGEVSLSDIIAQFSKNVRVLEQLETLVKTSVRAVDEICPLPNVSKRAGKFLSFDANGNPVTNVATETLETTLQGAKDAQTGAETAKTEAETAKTEAEIHKSSASDFALSSSYYATKSQSWAIGDGNDAETKNNNAKHYAESASEYLTETKGIVAVFQEAFASVKAELTQHKYNLDDAIDEHFRDVESDFAENVSAEIERYNDNAFDEKNNFNDNVIFQRGIFDKNCEDKTYAFNLNASSKEKQFNTNADDVLLQAKGYATEAKNARDEAVEIVDPEGWRTGTRAMIDSLAVAKANRGEFWFECGALTTTNKMPLNTPFSCVWTMAMTQEEFLQHKTFFPKFIGNLGYWSDAGYGWCINRIGNTLIGVGANNGGGSEKYNTLDIINYLDGNPHIWSVVYNGTNISLYIDNVKKTSLAFTFESDESTNPLGIGSTPTSANQNYGVWGKIYRIKYFNFDMSTDDAPYTIADYISGKDESPLLQGSQPVFDWKRVPTTATLVGNKLSFETGTTDKFYVYPLGETTQLKRGKTYILKGISNVVVGFYADKTSNTNTCNVSWQTINKTTSAVSTGSATNFYNPIMPFVNGEDVEFTIVFTPLVDGMIIFTYFPVGTIGDFEFYSAEQVGALLSLDDVKSGVQVIDKSGNGNHANISGVVYATKENNPARCVDSASFSWAGTATTQKFANSDVAIPANSKVVAYAKANVGMSASFTCGSNSAVSKELSANTLTEIGSFFNASQGAFKVAPSSATTGKIEVYLTIEKF